jgi:hypothetical protein
MLFDKYLMMYKRLLSYSIRYDKNDFINDVLHKKFLYLVEITIIDDFSDEMDESTGFTWTTKFYADLINKKQIEYLDEFENYDIYEKMKEKMTKHYDHYNIHNVFRYSKLTYLDIEEVKKILILKQLNKYSTEKDICVLNILRTKFDIDKYINLDINLVNNIDEYDTYRTNNVVELVIKEMEEIIKINIEITNLNNKKIIFFDDFFYDNDDVTEELFEKKYEKYKQYGCTNKPFINFLNFDINILEYAKKYI